MPDPTVLLLYHFQPLHLPLFQTTAEMLAIPSKAFLMESLPLHLRQHLQPVGCHRFLKTLLQLSTSPSWHSLVASLLHGVPILTKDYSRC